MIPSPPLSWCYSAWTAMDLGVGGDADYGLQYQRPSSPNIESFILAVSQDQPRWMNLAQVDGGSAQGS